MQYSLGSRTRLNPIQFNADSKLLIPLFKFLVWLVLFVFGLSFLFEYFESSN